MTGFTPKSDTEWDLNDHSGGCVRKESLQCGDGKMKGGFSVNPNVTLPGYSLTVPAAECQSTCLSNCSSCNAYAYDNNVCSIWMNMWIWSYCHQEMVVEMWFIPELLSLMKHAVKVHWVLFGSVCHFYVCNTHLRIVTD